MSQAVKQEFFRWIRNLNAGSLCDAQKKLLNTFITHFDTLAPLGTAGGKRAKMISKLIQAQHATFCATLPDINLNQTTTSERANRITELEIGPFRGFTSKEKFILNKKYAFLYGPNGSGKSSFCDGLEYALLGDIKEAAAKRITLPDLYPQHRKKCLYNPGSLHPSSRTEKNYSSKSGIVSLLFCRKKPDRWICSDHSSHSRGAKRPHCHTLWFECLQ